MRRPQGLSSGPKPYYEENGITIYHGDYREFSHRLPSVVDHVITDPPYSERTHKGHDSSASGHAGEGKDSSYRSGLGYGFLSEFDVMEYCRTMSRICSGWIVTFNDRVLAPLIQAELLESKRYVFAPIPFYSPGRSVRLSGDGPCSWTDWIVVSRTAAQVRWGTLPGGYVFTSDREYMGGKPLSLMLSLVRDYSKSGECILDPFMGSGTTLLAAKELGRRVIGIDISEEACEIAANRLRQSVFNFDTVAL